MKNYSIIIFIISLSIVLSCKKKKKDSEAKQVTITIVEPTIGDTIPSWNQLHVEGTISGDGEMHGYHISIINTATNSILFTKSSKVKAKAYNFHEHWINNLHDTTTVDVKIEAIKNATGNIETVSRNVVCLP